MAGESNGKVAFLNTLLAGNIGMISVLVLRAWTCLKARYSLRDYRNVLISFAFNLGKYFEVVFNF